MVSGQIIDAWVGLCKPRNDRMQCATVLFRWIQAIDGSSSPWLAPPFVQAKTQYPAVDYRALCLFGLSRD